MTISVGVENFGKIIKAEIDISNYTVFVGDNNSGKTYLMQLIYGLLQYFSFDKNYSPIHARSLLEDIKREPSHTVSSEEMALICKEINSCLEHEKNALIQKIFHRDIPVEKLYVNCVIEDNLFLITHNTAKKLNSNGMGELEVEEWRVKYGDNERALFYFESGASTYSGLLNLFLFSIGMDTNYRLFMPASRTGIQLLYKEFFAQTVDNILLKDGGFSKNNLGMTLPVYDFLRFLQTYKADDGKTNSRVVDFIESNLLSGHLQINSNNSIDYIPQGNSVRVPLYMASSMINEIAPIVMMLTSGKYYEYLLIDEVETSLHPKKQREMMRLLSRINNKRIRLLISTHSDTMASYLNLIAIISKNESLIGSKLNALGLEKEDILKNNNIHFYQFNEVGNKSEVEELYFRDVPATGVGFELFDESLDKLYETSKIVMGVKE